MDAKGGPRFLLVVFYESPWEKLSAWFLGVRKDGTLRWEIPMHPKGWRWLFSQISAALEKRDQAWINRYAASGKKPHSRWRR